ncbi:permease DsdX [Candidatus Sodalis endolongispinus]|uniref:Permease DsdX n=1 Tax=Candidatus Sodalis endolongispinus TaxID=2812662 RepID=A0ABS5YD80_9GAMM|nr:gluconate:H+ symporter [Candidatus Sodalis endolongispinus]MBT9432942.1 permease DsdX [Candidatus Sodalis endolongispinus]
MHFDYTQFLWLICSIAVLIILITRFKFHPFLALIIAAGFLGIAAGLSQVTTIKSFEKGFGGVLASTGLVVGLGTMLGGVLLETGGADKIANTFIRLGPTRTIPATICVAALIIGLPHLFDVSFVMLVPLVYAIAQRTKTPLMRVGIPMAAGLYVAHGLLLPHPAPTLAMTTYHTDAGMAMFYGLFVAVPMAILSVPVFTHLAMKYFPELSHTGTDEQPVAPPTAHTEGKREPSFALSMFTILLPPLLMMTRTLLGHAVAPENPLAQLINAVGDPIVSLLVAVLFSLYALGVRSGYSMQQLQKILGKSLGPAAAVILILGAGGGFKEMLLATHVSTLIADWAVHWNISPLVLAWLVAALIRIAIVSATVAVVTTAGIVAPLAANSGVNLELLVLATSTGGLMLSHVNDSGFWLFKEYFRLTVSQTLKSWTLLVSFQSLLGLLLVLLLNLPIA